MIWTREHDAHIARACEELDAWRGSSGRYHTNPKGQMLTVSPLPHYSTDLAATIRAAEAWRKQGKNLWWRLESVAEHVIPDAKDATAQIWHGGDLLAQVRGPNALAEALYLVTEGRE